MSFLLDTNVISELRKGPSVVHAGVREWAERQSPSRLYLSVITVFEIELGIARVQRRDPHQAAVLDQWLQSAVLAAFAARLLPVDVAVSRLAARLHVPDPRPERDALLAATAVVHDLTVVTRNVADFEPMGVRVFDPWGHRP